MKDLATAVSEWAGRSLPYNNLPASEYRQVLAKAGVPKMFIEISVGTDVAIARGDLDSGSRDLHALIGRDTQTVQDVLASLPKPSSQE
jgi:NAD(P)H dehydrogenase (quinone)